MKYQQNYNYEITMESRSDTYTTFRKIIGFGLMWEPEFSHPQSWKKYLKQNREIQ